ncbi:GGDEF domain-containing protein [Nocardia sp. NPDC005978]|uniref:GGDEF domain-containing protein n=1 Tax=unclassified Nocardia TaxID=2637762 RepID=UPI0033A345C1
MDQTRLARAESDAPAGAGLAGYVGGWMLLAAVALTAIFARELVLDRFLNGCLMLSGVVAALGIAMLLLGRRTPSWLLNAAPLLIIVLGTIPDSGETLLVWAVLYAGCLLTEAATLLTTAAAVVIFGAGAVVIGDARDVALWCQVSASLILVCCVIVQLRRRITGLVSALDEQASCDGLTGLANRRRFTERLENEVAAHIRHGRPLAVWFLDIDEFKHINDVHGHTAGDTALRNLAPLLLDRMRPNDLVARTGGEEFAVILPDTTAAEAAVWAEALRAEIESSARAWPVALTVSIGVAATPDFEAPDLFRAADIALHSAKRQGRNTVRTAVAARGAGGAPAR